MSLAVLRWLVADTLRQSLWSGVFWLMLGVTAAGVLACFAVPASEAHFLIGGVGANIIGLLLGLTFTAGVLPSFVDPNAALILLAKPVRRWQLLLGKFLGVMALFALHAALFVLATWLALGAATGRWPGAYFVALPILLMNFACFFSFSALLAVTTRNVAACVVGTFLFWFLCLLMNLGRHAVIAYEMEQFSSASRFIAEAAYWMMPKPADALVVMHDALLAEPLALRDADFAKVVNKGEYRPNLSLAASLIFPFVVTALAAYELESTEY